MANIFFTYCLPSTGLCMPYVAKLHNADDIRKNLPI